MPTEEIQHTGRILNHLTVAEYQPDINAPEVFLNNDGLLLTKSGAQE